MNLKIFTITVHEDDFGKQFMHFVELSIDSGKQKIHHTTELNRDLLPLWLRAWHRTGKVPVDAMTVKV